jgi:hypothetical protein
MGGTKKDRGLNEENRPNWRDSYRWKGIVVILETSGFFLQKGRGRP